MFHFMIPELETFCSRSSLSVMVQTLARPTSRLSQASMHNGGKGLRGQCKVLRVTSLSQVVQLFSPRKTLFGCSC